MMGAISKKTLSRIQWTLNITTLIFTILCELMIVLVSAFFFLQKSNMVGKPPTMGVYVGCFLVILIMLLFDGLVTVISGVLVISTIKKTTRAVMATSQKYHKQQHSTTTTPGGSAAGSSSLTPRGSIESEKSSNLPSHAHHGGATERNSIDRKMEQRIQSPFKVTFGLLMALVACILFQLVAAGIASGATEIDIIKPLWYFFNCLGVLVFAVIILFLFYPMFVNTEVAFKEIEISKSNAQKGLGFHNGGGSISHRSTSNAASIMEKEMMLHANTSLQSSPSISPSTVGTSPESKLLLQVPVAPSHQNEKAEEPESPSHHNSSSASSSMEEDHQVVVDV